MKKRLFSLFLVVMMVATLFSNAIVSIAITDNEEKLELFSDVLFSEGDFSEPDDIIYKDSNLEDFANLLDLMAGLDDPKGFATAFGTAYDSLSGSQETYFDGKITNIVDIVSELAIKVENRPDFASELAGYISDGDSSSFNIEMTGTNYGDVFDDVVSLDQIELGLSKLSKVFTLLNSGAIAENRLNFIDELSTGNYRLDESKLRNLLSLADVLDVFSTADIDKDESVDSFEALVTYYNELSNETDRGDIYGYLDGYGFIDEYVKPPTGGGSTTTPPVIEDVDEDFSQAIEEDFETAGDVLDENASEADTEEEAQEVLNNTSIYIGAASDNLSENLEEAEEQIEKVASTVTNVGNTLDLIEDQEEAEEKVATIMESIAHMIENVQDSGADTSSLDKAAESLVSKVVEKAGTTTVASTKDGTKATADLSDLDMTEQIQKVKSAADNMGTKLEENQIQTIKQKIETKVTINVETEGEVNEVDVTVPDLDEAFETVDKVKISSSIASFELEKDTFDTQSDDDHEDKINLNAKKPTEEELDEIKSNLAPGQSIPEGAEVIQLSASIQKVSRSTGEGVSTTPVTTFKQRIKLSVPYTLKEGENPKEVSVFLVQDDGTIKKVGGVYNPTTKQAEFYRKTFSNYYVAASRVTFDDTANLETMYKDAIEILAGKGLIAGKTLSLYDPDALVTRAEFTVLIARMLDLEADPAELPFNDVDNDNAWYRNHLAGAYNAGIINGTSATTFHPQNKITRQEAAAIAVNAARFLGYKDADGSKLATRYQDHEQIVPWAVRSVATVHRDKLAEGMYDGSFMPKELVTRDETAVLIYNMLFEY